MGGKVFPIHRHRHTHTDILLEVRDATRFPELDVVSSGFSPSTLSRAKKSIIKVGWAIFFCATAPSCVLPSSYHNCSRLFFFPEDQKQSFPWDFNFSSLCQTSWSSVYIWVLVSTLGVERVSCSHTVYSIFLYILQLPPWLRSDHTHHCESSRQCDKAINLISAPCSRSITGFASGVSVTNHITFLGCSEHKAAAAFDYSNAVIHHGSPGNTSTNPYP
jgi:hypothetical protein